MASVVAAGHWGLVAFTALNAPFFSTSESLLGSLCREAQALRGRGIQLAHALERCCDRSLRDRLGAESRQVLRRRRELLEVARAWQRQGRGHSLALELLVELSSRPIPAA